MPRQEEYYVHYVDEKTCRITKAIGGTIKADSTYETTHTNCQCYQAVHRGQCRHMKIRHQWCLSDIYPRSAIFDFDRQSLSPMPDDAG